MQIDKNHLFSKHTSRYYKWKTRIDNIYILKHTLARELKIKGAKVYVVFVDLKAACHNLNTQELIIIYSFMLVAALL